jgi:hypothetical protein
VLDGLILKHQAKQSQLRSGGASATASAKSPRSTLTIASLQTTKPAAMRALCVMGYGELTTSVPVVGHGRIFLMPVDPGGEMVTPFSIL